MRIYGDNGFKIELPTGNVDDVKINGTSVVDANKVANIPIPDNSHGLGVVGTHIYYGLQTITTGTDIGLVKGVEVNYSKYVNESTNGFIISKGTLENVLTGKGFLTENEAVTKTATGTQTIKSALFIGGPTSDVGFGNAIVHQRKLGNIPDSIGRTVYGAGFQVGNPSTACELITKTWDDDGAHPYNTAVLRMSPSGLSFGVNGSPSSSHTVPTEAEYKKVALADDLSLNKSGGDLLLKHGTTTVSTLSNAIPTKTSDLTNDAGFITSTSLPTKVSDLLNDSGFLTTANIATSLTPGVIKSGYQLNVASDGTTSCGTLTKTSYASANTASFVSKGTLDNILTDYALSSEVPVKISDLTDDSNFIEDTDYATTSKGGTIKLSDLYCTDVWNGILFAQTISASDLDNANGSAFVSMQTMRNQLQRYMTLERAEDTLVSKSAMSSTVGQIYSALSSGLASVASSIPHNVSDLNNDSGFLTSVPEPAADTLGGINTYNSYGRGYTATSGNLQARVFTSDTYSGLDNTGFISKGTLDNILQHRFNNAGVGKVALDSTDGLTAQTLTYSQFMSSGNAAFIGKGTLENYIAGKKIPSVPWYYPPTSLSDCSSDINDILSEYGRVLLGPGTYYVKDAITLVNNQIIEGCGPQTIIKWHGEASNSNCIIYVLSNVSGEGPERICIKNLCVKGIEDSEVDTSIDFTSSTVPSTVPIGIKFWAPTLEMSKSLLDVPIIIENVIMENLYMGLRDMFVCRDELNPYYISVSTTQKYEPVSDRLYINGCTFRNCYFGYSEERTASWAGGGVTIKECLFNRTRYAIVTNHFGYDVVNCAFYHTYRASFYAPYTDSDKLNNIPIRFTNCRFFMPAEVNVSHIQIELYTDSSVKTMVIIDGCFFVFGYMTSIDFPHLKMEYSKYIISNCRFMMRARGSAFMNYIGIDGGDRYPLRNFLINTISDTQIAPFGGDPIVLNSFTDTGEDIIAE